MKYVSTAILALLLTIPQLTFAAPRVVVSLKPLHSLVVNLMQGVAEPDLLIDNGSPHGYSLRPSQARMLSKADLIIWVGPEMESFLSKPLSTLAEKNPQLALASTLHAQMLPVQEGGEWEAHDHADHAEGEEQHESDHDTPRDQHLWLSPRLAGQIATECAAALERVDPANAAIYRENLVRLNKRLKQLDEQLQQQLAPVKDVPYIVFHTAYQYFEKDYQLNTVGSVTFDPERQPGAKRLSEIRARIKELGARCVFSEPQFESKLVATLTEGLDVRSGVLDPLGTELEAGSECYFTLLKNLADNLVAGLK